LTPLGEEILGRARRVLAEAEELVDAARAGAEPLAGTLRLGVIPTIGPYLMPRALARFRRSFPKLQLYLREEQTAPLLAQLADGKLDLVLLALPYATEEFETMPLGSDPIEVVLPKDHPLAKRRTIPTDALAEEKLLLMEDGHCLRSHALEACRLTSAGRNENLQGTSLRTVVQMAAGGLGVTLVPRLALTQELPAEGNLVARPLDKDAPPRVIALTWRRGAARREEFRRFAVYVKDVLAKSAG
jgi:LysR family hydrogen peroxide-inducible transcriptional activator